MKFIATTKLGLESVTAFQLKRMDIADVQNADANVSFSGSFADMAKVLLYLRTAERLLLEVGSFEATTFEALFEGVKALESRGLRDALIQAVCASYRRNKELGNS